MRLFSSSVWHPLHLRENKRYSSEEPFFFLKLLPGLLESIEEIHILYINLNFVTLLAT